MRRSGGKSLGVSLIGSRTKQEKVSANATFLASNRTQLDMRHYRIHISSAKVETIELATSTFCLKLMSYGLN